MKHDSNSESGSSQSRRKFLTNMGVGGTVALGVLSSPSIYAGAKKTASLEKCRFTALAQHFVYLNSGTEGSMPDCVIKHLQKKLYAWASDPTTSYELDAELGKRQELNRQRVGEFFGVGKDNITLTDNTTMGLSMTLLGLNFQADDKVIITNHEHNAILSPLQVLDQRIGLDIKVRKFPLAAKLSKMSHKQILDALFPNSDALRNAKALCVSHVYPSTGIRLPLKELRKKADQLNIQYVIVDGAQAMGMLDLSAEGEDISSCDFYAGPGHKWMNGPPSTGVLYLKNKDIQPPEFYPVGSQRMSKYLGDESKTFPMAKALQVRGCSNTVGFSAMLEATKFIQQSGGSSAVEKHILDLSKRVKSIISLRAPHALISPDSDEKLMSGLTVFSPFNWKKPQQIYSDKKKADWVVRELLKKNIQIRSIGLIDDLDKKLSGQKRYVLRVSTAYFNTEADINLFQKELKEVLLRIR